MSTEINKSNDVPRFQMSEVGYNGLAISAGRINEEIKTELQFPHSIMTYKQMSYDSMIASALSYYEHMMLKAKFSFLPHPLADETQKEYSTFMQECVGDMEHSWQDFIQEVASMNTYGFCANEIVLRKRLRSKGSKYNDGKIGIKKLPIRSQDSISKWNYNADQELVSLEQTVSRLDSSGRMVLTVSGEPITIPRNKFLLFRLGKKKDSPVGESPLRGCYYPWKFKTAVEELEAVGLNRDLAGVPIAWIPPQLMAKDASPDDKAQYLEIQKIVRNINNNQQAGLVMPMIYNEDKLPLVKFELLKNEGGKAYDTTKIKDYYCKAILTALSADILLMGQSSTGSYALGNIKNTLSAIAIETKLKEICNVLNQHLIPLLAKLNDWDLGRLPTIVIDDLESVSLEDVSKYIQRIGAVGFLPRTPDVVNKVLNILGLEDLPVDVSLDDVLPDKTTRSGEGMEEGLNNGIGDNGNQEDESSNNLDNAS